MIRTERTLRFKAMPRGLTRSNRLRSLGGPSRLESLLATSAAYISLAKPRVVGLLLLVAVIAYVTGAKETVEVGRLALLAAAGGISAAGAAMLNHYFERDLDALMLRTKNRPLPSGRVASPALVAMIGAGLVASGTALGFALGPLVGLMVGTGAFVYVQAYTLHLKRRTHWSTVVGGVSGSCAVLAGWFTGAPPSISAMLLGLLLFVWQVAHFWPLTMARLSDFERAGLPTLPNAVGVRAAGIATLLAATATAGVSLGFGVAHGLGPIYFGGTVVLALIWLSATARLVAQPSERRAFHAFKSSGFYLAAIFLLMLIDFAPGT